MRVDAKTLFVIHEGSFNYLLLLLPLSRINSGIFLPDTPFSADIGNHMVVCDLFALFSLRELWCLCLLLV